MSVYGRITLVRMCGNEGAQVVAAFLPSLLRRSAPGTSLRSVGCASGLDSLAEATDGYIVMLPPDILQARSAWHRFKKAATSRVPVLPVIVGDTRGDGRLYGCRSGARNDDWQPRWNSHCCLQALPLLHIPRSDARIEHGGKFHLERDATSLLDKRLRDLRSLALADSARGELPTRVGCACSQQSWLS